MKNGITIEAPAKLNLMLQVVGKRPDGYHDLDMLMLPVGLYDTIHIAPAEEDRVTFDLPGIPKTNTVTKALAAYRRVSGKAVFACVQTEKRIPHEAGLGGGSADAAAVLKGMEALFGPLPQDQRLEAAVSVGADVPFCLHGGICRAEGIGERLTALAPPPAPLWFLLVKPAGGVSTPALFRSLVVTKKHASPTLQAVAALKAGDLPALGACFHNDLAPSAFALLPELAVLQERLLSSGALGAGMTGSGSCMFGLFETEAMAEKAKAQFSDLPFAAVVKSL